jgi:2-oxoglutarate ferredoxin oxidoreductase subunit gamma
MIERVIIAGAGGQGIMLLGKVLAEAAMDENKRVTWLPSYGAEVRGGTANCMVVISDEDIGSPFINIADSLIIMNEPSLSRFAGRVKDTGVLVVNGSLVKGDIKTKAKVLKFGFTELANSLGNPKVANMVALGCFLAETKLIDLKSVVGVFEKYAPKNKKELVLVNKNALLSGAGLVTKNLKGR